ncbi:hypothetical protein [Nodosilinea nodulosa]|nr:hypothetical protein [Nodosilinea nodulosa]
MTTLQSKQVPCWLSVPSPTAVTGVLVKFTPLERSLFEEILKEWRPWR